MRNEETRPQMEPDCYRDLLGGNLLGNANHPTAGAVYQPDPGKRMLFIGIGGSGVKTLNQLKVMMTERMVPGWNRIMAFLAIDSDRKSLEEAEMLNLSEWIRLSNRITVDTIQQPEHLPETMKQIIPQPVLENFPIVREGLEAENPSSRLMAKARLHDRLPGHLGIDGEIVRKIRHQVEALAALPDEHMAIDVFVIASCAGNVGSGVFPEIPPLVREAFGELPNPVHIYGMLYLPDLMAQMDPRNAGWMQANGYAALKELNYFQGMKDRAGYSEFWPYTDGVRHELHIPGDKGLYDVPYLIGIPGMGGADLRETARETVAEYLFQLAVDKQHNTVDPGNTLGMQDKPETGLGTEASCSAHEFPKQFASVGMIRAGLPEKTIRAYIASRVMEKAGMVPVSAQKRKDLADRGGRLPFAAADQLQSASAGTREAEELLQPVYHLHRIINNGRFSLVTDVPLPPEDLTWETIRNRSVPYRSVVEATEAIIARTTDAYAGRRLRDHICECYRAYAKNVEAYVKQHGPEAFVNLFRGRFVPENGEPGVGILEMMQNLPEGRTLRGGPVPVQTVAQAHRQLEEAEHELHDVRPLLPAIPGFIPRARKKLALQNWIRAYDELAVARINEKRRGFALGKEGVFVRCFCEPAIALTRQIACLSHVLTGLYQIYSCQGRTMEDWMAFREIRESPVSMNIGKMDQALHEHLLRAVQNDVEQTPADQLRETLIAAFFEDPEGWTRIPDEIVQNWPAGELRLVSEGVPIPARLKMDDILDRTLVRNSSNLYDLLEQSNPRMIAGLIRDMFHRSSLCFSGTPDPGHVYEYVEYPAALAARGPQGQQLVNAIHSAALSLGIPAGNINPVNSSNEIVLIRQASSMEVYRVGNLPSWEAEYLFRCGQGAHLFHGKSPDLTRRVDSRGDVFYDEGQPWVDYPSIVYREDYRTEHFRDEPHRRESRHRRTLEREINDYRKLGVMYEALTNFGWVIRCAVADSGRDWFFDLNMATVFPEEPAPTGKALLEEVAKQNGLSLNEITREVRLENSGVFSKPAPTVELAWDYAVRVLRANHPLLCRIRRTAGIFAPWNAACEAYNVQRMNRIRPQLFAAVLKAGILTRDLMGVWWWQKEDSTRRRIADFSRRGRGFLNRSVQAYLDGDLTFYALYRMVCDVVQDEDFIWEYARAQEIMKKWVTDMDMEALSRHQEAFRELEAERETLWRKGMARKSDAETVSNAFAMAMESVERDREVLLEIQRFYALTDEY